MAPSEGAIVLALLTNLVLVRPQRSKIFCVELKRRHIFCWWLCRLAGNRQLVCRLPARRTR